MRSNAGRKPILPGSARHKAEGEMLRLALIEADANVTAAASALKMDRPGLYRKLRRHPGLLATVRHYRKPVRLEGKG